MTGYELKQLIKQHKLTAKHVAQEFGMTPAGMTKIFKSEKVKPVYVLALKGLICEAKTL